MSDTRGHDEISRLRQLIMGFRVTQLIYVAAKLDLADHLARGPLTAPELASSLGVDAGALYRLLRALASLDVFVESSDGRFEMTPAAELLRRHAPGSLHSTAMLYGDELLCTPATHDTQKFFALSGIAGRSKFIQGNFFIAVPGGGDLYLLKSILHNWHDSAAATILGKCRDAMAMDARLLVAERVIPSGNAPSEAKLFDINMLVTVGGRERTEAEYVTLFRSAGLELRKVTPTRSHLSLIEAARLERN
jgi:hypothetical protein